MSGTERSANYSSKLARRREYFEAQRAAELRPPPKPLRVYNKPERAAKGRGVPPSQKENAPHLMTPLLVEGNSLLITPGVADDNGSPTYNIVGPDGDVYAEAGSMAALIAWLDGYAHQVDGLADE
jgi:hypothetical protein